MYYYDMAKWKLWKDEEINYLLDNRHLSHEDVAQYLERSYKSIQQKRLKLGMLEPNINPSIVDGMVFGRLTVIERSGTARNGQLIWRCNCVCGNTTDVQASSLRLGQTKSCGCYARERRVAVGMRKRNSTVCQGRLPPGEASWNVLWKTYQYQASNRDLTWELTKDQFKNISSQNCFYCGSNPKPWNKYSNEKDKTLTEDGINRAKIFKNGIDRKDNSKGYTEDNCVPCCEKCNKGKMAMSVGEFISWAKQIANYHSDINE